MTAIRTEQLAEDVVLHLGDCRDLLPALGPIDAVVSDVPYGIAFEKGAGGKGIHPGRVRNLGPIIGDDVPFDPTHLLGWPCVLFGANHYCQRLPAGGSFLAWDKSCGRGPDDSFADVEFIWASFKTKARVFRYLWKGVLQDGEKGAPKYHISQKPVALMAWCLRLVPDARIICDPYMGSGSTGVAAIADGRGFLGCELDQRHFDTACRRIADELRRPRLFAEPVQAMKQEALSL